MKAQSRIDSVEKRLLGLTDEDFVEVPVLASRWYGKDFAVPNPGIQNLVAANQVLFIPDPEGPMTPTMIWCVAWVRGTLEATGHQVEFVDVLRVIRRHRGGCLWNNFEREPFDSIWWGGTMKRFLTTIMIGLMALPATSLADSVGAELGAIDSPSQMSINKTGGADCAS